MIMSSPLLPGCGRPSAHPRCHQQPAQRHHPAPHLPPGHPPQHPRPSGDDPLRLRHDPQEQQGGGGHHQEGARRCRAGAGQVPLPLLGKLPPLLPHHPDFKLPFPHRWTTRAGTSSTWRCRTPTLRACCSSSASRLTSTPGFRTRPNSRRSTCPSRPARKSSFATWYS